MNKKNFLCFIFLGLLLADCAYHKKIKYDIPETIPQERREQFLELLERGRKLYELNCSKCHGIFTKGNDTIANFTDQQIDTYKAYFIRRDPKNHAVAAKMNTDQLNEVFMFIKCLKRKHPIPPPMEAHDTLRK